ncbi:hypothetical protein H0H92_004034 [Tricholoma furcatifolium]|nr:hypothetical protein H0H92_004034 [Tricholoma furcatifolium]
MFSSPTPAPGSRAIATNALRSAGLIDRDRDTTMRDVTDKPGGRKASSKIRSHRPRVIDSSYTHGARLRAQRLNPVGPSDVGPPRGGDRLRTLRPSLSGSSASVSHSKTKPVEAWRELIRKRWNPEAQFLNLESLIEDEIVKKNNLLTPGHGGSSREAAVIFKLAKELTPKVKTLSLGNNNLQGVHLHTLGHYLPDLVNLSLQNNNIRTMRELDIVASRRGRLLHLKELVLLGNPIQVESVKKNTVEKFRRDVTFRFTTIEVLDQVSIAQIGFDRPGPSSASAPPESTTYPTTFPAEMGLSFITGVDGALVSNFLVRFFNAMDTQRSALADVYDPNATFSFSLNTTIAARARVQGLHTRLPNQTKLSWQAWLEGGSRNLSRVGPDFDRAYNSLHIGADDAVKALIALPATRHDISGPPDRFCLDSFPVVLGQGMGLLLTIHGQFTEVGSEGFRSFDRSMILMPAPEGSRAKANGWDIIILSDQWTVRVYSTHEAWKPGPLLVQALPREEAEAQKAAPSQPQQQPSLDQQSQAALAALPETQRNLVMEVSQRTKLNIRFSIDCLTGNGWDMNNAIANFEQVKATLSRDAFL